MDYVDLCSKISGKLDTNIKTSLTADNLKKWTENYFFLSEYKKWIDFISPSYESRLYNCAKNDYEISLFFSAESLYKESFMSLRSFLEQSLFGVMLSVNEYNYRLWKNGKKDLCWSNIIDPNDGIFSQQFISIFYPPLLQRGTDLMNKARNIYRMCSEYTHGNYDVTQNLFDYADYDNGEFNKFMDLVKDTCKIITFSFFIRFNEQIKKKKALHEFESTIMDEIGNIPEIEDFFNE